MLLYDTILSVLHKYYVVVFSSHFTDFTRKSTDLERKLKRTLYSFDIYGFEVIEISI